MAQKNPGTVIGGQDVRLLLQRLQEFSGVAATAEPESCLLEFSGWKHSQRIAICAAEWLVSDEILCDIVQGSLISFVILMVRLCWRFWLAEALDDHLHGGTSTP